MPTALHKYLSATVSRLALAMAHAARPRGYRTNVIVNDETSAQWWVLVHETKDWPDLSLAHAQRLRVI